MIEFGEKYTVREDSTWETIKGATVLIVDTRPTTDGTGRYFIGEIVSDHECKGSKYYFLANELSLTPDSVKDDTDDEPTDGDIVFEVDVYLDGQLRTVHYLYSDDEMDKFRSDALGMLTGIANIEIIVKRV